MASTGDRREHFPKIEAKHGLPVEHWFDQLAHLESDKYPDQVGFLQAEHGFSKAHANAVVMFYRGSDSSKRHDDPGAYFAALSPAQRETAEAIFEVIRQAHPELEMVMAWNQPMLRRGKDYVFGLSASTHHLSVNPFSPQVLAELGSNLDGYDVLKHTVRIPLAEPIDPDLLLKMVALRLAELQHNPL